jgi:DNA polymerase-1
LGFRVTVVNPAFECATGISKGQTRGYGQIMCGQQPQPGAGENRDGGVSLLIDGHAYAYRAFFAIRQLHAPDGRPVNALFGFIKMVSRLREELQPSHLAVVWDGGLDQNRLRQLPLYKANRPPMPADLERQLTEIERSLSAALIASLRFDGVEADDCLATLTRQAVPKGLRVIIASPDKDFMQLVRGGVGLVNAGDSPLRVWNEADVRTKTGVAPDQIVDWLSLVGDSVDNIPGVTGVGPKTAARLLADFGSIPALFGQIDRVEPERLRRRLREAAAVTTRNRELIRLRDDLDISANWNDMASPPLDNPALQALYQEWGFRSLLRSQVQRHEVEQDLFAAVRE